MNGPGVGSPRALGRVLARTSHIALAAVVAVLAVPASARAQSPAPPNPQTRFEFGIAGVHMGGMTLSSSDANLVRPDGTPLTLFQTVNRLSGATGVELAVAVRVAGRLGAEVSGDWTRTNLESAISGDFEGASPVTAKAAVARVTVEASAVWRLFSFGSADVFVRAGGGWLRDLASNNRVHEDGSVANAGIGMKYWWKQRPSGRFKRLGLRVDGRAFVRSKGISIGAGKTHVAPAVSAGALIGF